ILDAIELAVPDFARSKDAFDDLSSLVPVADAARCREQSSVARKAARGPRVGFLPRAAFRAHQVERVPVRDAAALAPPSIPGLERSEIDGFGAEHDVEDVEIRLGPTGGPPG